MATTTSNYAWAIPQSSDLVKDGATAIATLGSAIDTSMNTALGTKKAGLVLLNTTSFSGVSSQSISQFSASYENYRVLIVITAHSTTSGSHSIRLRSGSTDASGSNYFVGGTYTRVTGSTVTGVNTNGGTSFSVGDGVTTNTGSFYVFDFLSPFLTQKTGIFSQAISEDVTSLYTSQRICQHSLTTSYDGFSFISGAGSITGKLAIYGYNF